MEAAGKDKKDNEKSDAPAKAEPPKAEPPTPWYNTDMFWSVVEFTVTTVVAILIVVWLHRD